LTTADVFLPFKRLNCNHGFEGCKPVFAKSISMLIHLRNKEIPRGANMDTLRPEAVSIEPEYLQATYGQTAERGSPYLFRQWCRPPAVRPGHAAAQAIELTSLLELRPA